jgi:hypothetical protein
MELKVNHNAAILSPPKSLVDRRNPENKEVDMRLLNNRVSNKIGTGQLKDLETFQQWRLAKPEMQGMGVNATIFAHLIPVFKEKGIKWCETNPQLDTNIRELSQWKPLNPQTVKRRRCWSREIR